MPNFDLNTSQASIANIVPGSHTPPDSAVDRWQTPELCQRMAAVRDGGDGVEANADATLAASQKAGRTVVDARSANPLYHRACNDAGVAPDESILRRNEEREATAVAAKHRSDAVAAKAASVLGNTSRAISEANKAANRYATQTHEFTFTPTALTKNRRPDDVYAEASAGIADNSAQQSSAEKAWRPEGEALIELHEKLANLREKGRVTAGISKSGVSIRFRQQVLPVTPTTGSEVITTPDVEATLAFLCHDQLAEHLEADIHRRYQTVELTLSAEERRKRLAQLAARRLELERLEVEAVLALWAQGRTDVGLRADTNPIALLGITLGNAPASKPDDGGSLLGYRG